MRLALALCLAVVGCADPGPELPAGWEEATLLVDFTQSECVGDVGSENESIEVSGTPPTLRANWSKTQFRCAQDVEAFLRPADDGVDILVQPVDMNPEVVAGCDCLYDLSVGFNGTEDTTVFKFFKRSDELGGPSAPTMVFELSVQ